MIFLRIDVGVVNLISDLLVEENFTRVGDRMRKRSISGEREVILCRFDYS